MNLDLINHNTYLPKCLATCTPKLDQFCTMHSKIKLLDFTYGKLLTIYFMQPRVRSNNIKQYLKKLKVHPFQHHRRPGKNACCNKLHLLDVDSAALHPFHMLVLTTILVPLFFPITIIAYCLSLTILHSYKSTSTSFGLQHILCWQLH